jgi:hypothetical protein
MIKREEKPFLKESTNGKAIEDRLQDRLLWQDACNTAIKKQLMHQELIKQSTLKN